MEKPENPLGIALIICDRVITDANTQEKTLVGTFNRIMSSGFPCLHPRMSIFVAVTSGRGTTKTRLQCVQETEKEEVVFQLEGAISFPNPNHVVEMSFQMNNVTFNRPGLYSIEFFCDGELVLQSRFEVVQIAKS